MDENKNNFIVKFAATVFIVLLLTTNSLAESMDNGWEIDYKSTRVVAEMDEQGKVYADFIGTISNYGSYNASEVIIDIKILNDGIKPVKPEGGSDQLECYGTKAVYTINNFETGKTMDWIVHSEITDPASVAKGDIASIDYQIKVFVETESGTENVYTADKSIDIFLADSDGDQISDYMELFVYRTNPFDSDSDGDGVSDLQEIEAELNPRDPKSNGKITPVELIQNVFRKIYSILESDHFTIFDIAIAATSFLMMLAAGKEVSEVLGSIFILIFVGLALSGMGMFFGDGMLASFGRIAFRIMVYGFIFLISYTFLKHSLALVNKK